MSPSRSVTMAVTPGTRGVPVVTDSRTLSMAAARSLDPTSLPPVPDPPEAGRYLCRPGSAVLERRVAQRLRCCLGTGVNAELGVHLLEVRTHRLDVEVQRVGDLLVAEALRQQREHLALPCRQPVVVEWPAIRAVGLTGMVLRRRHDDVTSCDASQRLGETMR